MMRPKLLLSTLLLIALFAALPSSFAESRNGLQYSAATSTKAIISNKTPPTSSFAIEQAVSHRGGNSGQRDSLTGAVIMTLVERVTNRVLKSQGISFPSMLGGCIALLGFMLAAEFISPGVGDSMFSSLSPGSALLAKWLPVFFVPGLAMLPLAPSVGSGFEVAKVLAVVIIGWAYSISTVTYPVLFLRLSQGASNKKAAPAPVKKLKKKTAPAAAPVKPFADETLSGLLKGSVATAILSFAATKMGNDLATPLQSIFLGISTFATYVWAARLPSSFNAFIHPLITSTILTLGVICATGLATGFSFINVLKTYKTGTLDLMKTGAGDVLLFLLGPSVVSFAVAIYGRKKLLKENFLIVMIGMLISSGGGLFGTAAFVRLIQLGGKTGALVRLSVLSRNVTTALSMAIAGMLGGDVSIAASVVVLTGIFGATCARRTLDALGITDPITRGLATGASSQGLGVATLVNEPDAFPFAAMGMVLTAVVATCLVSIPAVKDALIKLSGGA
ncbi:unnamed protein product [Cylindrotheca closterium]|uniref:Plastidal glycolate/glycerate translocator 1, chloroplastic n=1 Tax=Cylindrotheca closterium TaxID=2856 RepID=A0AAD2FR73_9STRA|nr:unnamed protein product [Cylindrotheca closterium]